MESDRYKLTVLFLKTFFRSWALSVKLSTHRNRQQAHSMTHTSNLCPSTFSEWTCKLPLPAGTKNHVGRQTLERQEGEQSVWLCVRANYLKLHVGQKLFKDKRTSAHEWLYVHKLGPPLYIYAVCISTFSPCLFLCGNVCVCVSSPLGLGQCPGRGITFSQQEISHWSAPRWWLLQAPDPREQSRPG